MRSSSLLYGIFYNENLAPAQQAIEHVVTIYPLGFGHDLSPFQTPSSPELDQAWEDLYSCKSRPHTPSQSRQLNLKCVVGISRIPRHQAERLPNRTHAIPGDPGYYIAELDVFHELHCLVFELDFLKTLFQSVWPA